MYIVLAILIFGILIAVHELGHFFAAKKLGVQVNEFAIGMGPKLWSYTRGETTYCLRLLPIGGACVMEGEDEELPNPRAFTAQKRWKRVIILAAGAFMNFVFGLIVLLIIDISGNYVPATTTLNGLMDGFPSQGENGLMVGDALHSINGNRLYYHDDISLFMQLPDAKDGVIDLVIIRGGEKIKLRDFTFERQLYEYNGEEALRYGLLFKGNNATLINKIKYGFYEAYNFARIVRVSLVQFISGNAGISDMAGPVGIVASINEGAQSSVFQTVGQRIEYVFWLGALIAVNLAVMNLLPIPALDGGRIFGLVVTFVIEKVIRRRVNPKYEGYIHAGGIVLLLVLMGVIMISDIYKLI